jgi:poly(beta-D-mannuronate) lyase
MRNAKKLTRRGFLVAAAGGAAGIAYAEEGGRPAPKSLPPKSLPPQSGPSGPSGPGGPGGPSGPAAGLKPVATDASFSPVFVKPSQVLDLTTWKLGLPTPNDQQVTQPALAGFHDGAFRVVEAVQFTVSCGQQPQPGPGFPRSELREMNPDGTPASWPTTSGVHRMDLNLRVTHLPVAVPKLVCAQIHGVIPADYLILVVLDGPRLYVKYKDGVAGVLDQDYQLGTYFGLTLQASQGYLDVFYNGAHLVRQVMAEPACYFKAGCYLQSSTSLGDQAAAYGQVEITTLALSHR